MLNTFPTLLSFGLIAPLILRVTLGLVLIGIGILTISQKRLSFIEYFKLHNFPLPLILPWVFGIVEIIVGIFLIVGLSTQIAAIISVFLLLNLYSFETNNDNILPYSSSLYLILSIVALSLLFSGAGFFALDLPL